MNKDIEYFENCLESLHTNVQKGIPAPHKAILLLSIIDLIEDGSICDARIVLTEELVAKFNKLWKYYLGKSTVFSPDIYKPFYHLIHEPFWELVPTETNNIVNVDPRYNRTWMQSNYKFARLDEDLYNILLYNDRARAKYRLKLIGKYLVGQPIELQIEVASKKSSVLDKIFSIISLFVA